MNRLVSKFSNKKKKKYFLSESSLDNYPYSQISKFISAYLTKDNSTFARAAQAVFYWPSFSDLFKHEMSEDPIDDDIPSIRFVKFKSNKKKKRDRKKSKKLTIKQKIKGEYVSDELDVKLQPLEVSADTSFANESANSNSSKEIIIKEKNKIATNENSNWSEWKMNKSNSIKLSDYTKWLNNFQKKYKTKTTKKSKVQDSINVEDKNFKERLRSSLDLNEGIVSEPLADLLADQGHKKAAINMYEKLSLIFPEKSSFFAVKIDALKK